MLEELRAVYEVQKLDDRLQALASKRAGLVKSLECAGQLVEETELALAESKRALEEKEKAYRQFESDLVDNEEVTRRFKIQENDVKTNEQLWALQSEIRQNEKKKSDLEDAALLTMDEIDGLRTEITKGEKDLERARESSLSNKADLGQRMAKIEEVEAVTRVERDRGRALVPDNLLVRYEKLRKRNSGVGVGVVTNRACGACFRLITPRDVNIIKHNARIMFCEGCGTIMLWPNSPEEGSSGQAQT